MMKLVDMQGLKPCPYRVLVQVQVQVILTVIFKIFGLADHLFKLTLFLIGIFKLLIISNTSWFLTLTCIKFVNFLTYTTSIVHLLFFFILIFFCLKYIIYFLFYKLCF